jgi:hypothetical protein
MGAYTEIVDFTFTADETSRTFSGLSITEDDFIKIVITQVNAASSVATIGLFPNTAAGVTNFDTTTNYHSQRLTAGGTSSNAARDNVNRITATDANQTGNSISYFKISENGKTNYFTNRFFRNDSSLEVAYEYCTSSNLTFNDPITSLTFTANETDGLGDGSRIQIYRLDAEKVADFVVDTNSTQVDIPVTGSLDPAITKDSEYLLVSDVKNASGSSQDYELFVNDDTTSANYYRQRILGDGSSKSAVRTNTATILSAGNNEETMDYIHIKLSEIGAYTAQSYEVRNYGSTTPLVQNNFISSTSEAITSITELNVISSSANGISSGSRFILYKLK